VGDGLSYVFEIDEKLSGLDAANSKLAATTVGLSKADALTKKTSGSLKDLAARYEAVGGKADGAGKMATEAGGSSALAMGAIAAGALIAFEAVKRIGEAFIETGKDALRAAADAEQLDLSFRLKLGQEGAEAVLGWVDKIYSKLPFTDDQIKQWDLDLLNAGVSAASLDKFIAAAADVAAKSGNKMEGMSRAVEALKKAQLTGKIDTRELRGLSIGI